MPGSRKEWDNVDSQTQGHLLRIQMQRTVSIPFWNQDVQGPDLAFPFIGHIVQVAEPTSVNLQNEGNSTYYIRQLL